MKSRLIVFVFLFISLRSYSQCSLSVSITSSEPGICAGNTIALTATPAGGSGSYSYAWSNGETTNVAHVNKAGSYSVTVTDKSSGCTAVGNTTVNITPTPNPPTVTGGGIVCQGNSAHLTITSGGDSFQWYKNATDVTPFHTGTSYDTDPVTTFTIFYVEATSSGCTSARSTVVVTNISNPTAHDGAACYGSPVTLSVSGGDNFQWYTSPSSTTSVNSGAILNISSITNNTTYYVESVANGCTSGRTPVTAYVTSAPQSPVVSPNQGVCSGNVITLHADAPAGVVEWYDVASGGSPLIISPDYTTPTLTANTTYYVQTDLNGCLSNRVPVTVNVNPIPSAPANQTVNACYNSSAHLTASATGGAYQWYSDANGKHLLKNGTTYDTPALTHDITYYVMAVNGGCSSALTPVNVVVAAPVPQPSVINPPVICNGSTAVLTATAPGGNYQWFTTATGGTPLPTTENGKFTTPALTATTTYYVQTTIGSCTSTRTVVQVPVLAPLTQPTATGASICSGDVATLTADGQAGDYAWYNAAGDLLQVGKIFNTPALTATTTYYVQVSNNGCASNKTAVQVTVKPAAQAPVVNPGPTICPGETASLSATAPAGQSIDWFEVPAGGVSLHTGSNYQTDAIYADKSYYVQSTSGTCISARTQVDVKVNIGGTSFHYPSSTIVKSGNNPTPIIDNPSGPGIFSAPAGVVFVDATTGQINAAASTPGTYKIVLTSNGTCSGTYSSIITITDHPSTSFRYDTPVCQVGSNPKPIFDPGANAGFFSASPSGLTFVSDYTGEIDLSKTAPGTYTVTNAIPASGAFTGSVSQAKITIDKAITVSAGSNKSVPINTPVTLNGSISSGVTGTWSGGAGTFSNVNDLHAVYTPAVDELQAKLTLTSNDPPGACGIKTATVTITFNSIPPAPTAQSTQACVGSSVTLTATAPGGTYDWYADAVGGSSLQQGANFQTPALTTTTSYYVSTTVNGLTSPRTQVTVSIYNVPSTPVVPNDLITTCSGNVVKIDASGSVGTYEWFNESGQSVGTGASFTSTTLTNSTFYEVQAAIGQCVSPRKRITVTVTPAPYITSRSSDPVCSGNPLSYTITSNVPTAAFLWSRAAVAGITNAAVSNQTTTDITETLVNTTPNVINVTYVITPMNGTCAGEPIDYVVTVYPTPTIVSHAKDNVCYGTTANYAITFTTPNTIFTWSRAAIPGILNAAVNGQASAVIKEVLFNTTSEPIDVPYTINYKTNDCDGAPFNWIVTVYPQVNITSDAVSLACNKTPQNYTITSNVPSATFEWKRAAVAGISNAATQKTGALIDETLINTTTSPINVTYIITPSAYGCTGDPFSHIVTVNPKPDVPKANSNSPVCVASKIQLRTPSVAGATYLWMGPNNFSSTSQNVDIPATEAAAGTYNLFVTVGGCTSDPGPTTVQVNKPPVVTATGPHLVCTTATTISLNGTVGGGTTTGIWSSSSGGTGFSPSITTIGNVNYIPTAKDKENGSVTLTLSSTSNDDCTVATADVVVKFGLTPGVDAGIDQSICAQDTRVQLAGKILLSGATGFWSTATGDGTFQSGTQPNAVYLPGVNDKKKGSVTLTFNINNSGECYTTTDDMKVTFIPPAVLATEHVRYVLKGNTITLHPIVKDETVTYLWTTTGDPNNINDVHAKNPVITGGQVNQTYTLTITDKLGCVTSDTTYVIVSPHLSVSNAFSPNGDGTNDNWEIVGLVAYENSTVDVFNRYGTLIFHSRGYGVPWDGTSNGSPVPVGVYYYIVDTKVDSKRFTGYVTVLR
ncbi:PKD-like domain-containing protein [Mucilaginibacter flavus]|uniref:Ig-like domain-containing protein n=1 Tax=Mucilaginibacter flavus TaxID=931504 RepID=UPI0025B2C2F0|nr:PKD-like domain-containing protein [Mucilaginibacter flavus]MDN3583353.1 gliding motility-associated C-terminal domain-containing protein [Mucilaginibacter flavus]